jgi:hypothetical protein
MVQVSSIYVLCALSYINSYTRLISYNHKTPSTWTMYYTDWCVKLEHCCQVYLLLPGIFRRFLLHGKKGDVLKKNSCNKSFQWLDIDGLSFALYIGDFCCTEEKKDDLKKTHAISPFDPKYIRFDLLISMFEIYLSMIVSILLYFVDFCCMIKRVLFWRKSHAISPCVTKYYQLDLVMTVNWMMMYPHY